MDNYETVGDAEWGSIDDVLNGPLEGVEADESWCSVFCAILLAPIHGIVALFAGLCKCCYVCVAVTGCCSAYNSVMAKRPCWMSPNWWIYSAAMTLVLIKSRAVRLRTFMWEREAFGDDEYWWHGSGIWCGTHALCDEIARSQQERTKAFGCERAPVPDIYPPDILIFLSNNGPDSEWWAIRQAIHGMFLDMGLQSYVDRTAGLPQLVAGDWPDPKLSDMDDVKLVTRTVCKCIFYVAFGVWVSDDEATTLTGWRTLAPIFVFPRIGQRMLFNLGVAKVKQLRRNTVSIIEDNNLQDTFMRMNASLPEAHQRSPVVKLCDEIMYVLGFAGMGGTSACTETVGAFLQLKMPKEAAGDKTDLSNFGSISEMVDAYRADPDAYIKEACRLNPPVTSATSVVKSDMTVQLAGQEVEIPRGMLRQYAISIANRDPEVFDDPEVFNPQRPELSCALTWNGGFGMDKEDQLYPRICPGRTLSLTVCKTIINHVLSSPDAFDNESGSSSA